MQEIMYIPDLILQVFILLHCILYIGPGIHLYDIAMG
jgi:hypothetical protein